MTESVRETILVHLQAPSAHALFCGHAKHGFVDGACVEICDWATVEQVKNTMATWFTRHGIAICVACLLAMRAGAN